MCKARVSEDPIQAQVGFVYDQEARQLPTLSVLAGEA